MTRCPERISRSAFILVSSVINWPPVCVLHVQGGGGTQRSPISYPAFARNDISPHDQIQETSQVYRVSDLAMAVFKRPMYLNFVNTPKGPPTSSGVVWSCSPGISAETTLVFNAVMCLPWWLDAQSKACISQYLVFTITMSSP